MIRWQHVTQLTSPMRPPSRVFTSAYCLKASAFSLIELLSVLGIIAILSMVAGPAIRSLKGAGDVNQAIADSSRFLELARLHAMANNTYVRVAIAPIPASGGRMTDGTMLVAMNSADGTLGADESLGDPSKWPMIGRPLILENLVIDDKLDTPLTTADVTPSGANVQGGTLITPISRPVPGQGSSPVAFSSFIQFSPSGESRVARDEPARNIKLGFQQSVGSQGNPFILRLSGSNGRVSILRKEDGI